MSAVIDVIQSWLLETFRSLGEDMQWSARAVCFYLYK